MLAGRVLGIRDFGVFSFSQSISIMFLTFSSFGLNILLMRDVSRNNDIAQRYLSNILSWRIILSAITYLFLMLTVIFFMNNSSQIEKIVAILGLAVLMKFFSMTGISVLRAFERFDLEALIVILEQFLLLVLGGFFLLSGMGIYAFAFSFLVVRLCGCFFTFSLVKKLTSFSFQFNLPLIMELQLKAIPLGAIIIVSTAYVQVNTLIVANILDYQEVGLYNAAFKIYFGLYLLPKVFQTIFFPRLSRSFYESKQEHNTFLVKGILSLFLTSLPISIFGIIYSDQIVILAFGNEFLGATSTMKIFFVVLIITFQIMFLRTIFVSIDRQIILLVFNIAGLFVLIVLNYCFIPKFGIAGAAIALGSSEIFVFMGLWIYLFKKHFQFTSIPDVFTKILSAVNLNVNY
jgi:O-antigen/teichoic acid export membrane protein